MVSRSLRRICGGQEGNRVKIASCRATVSPEDNGISQSTCLEAFLAMLSRQRRFVETNALPSKTFFFCSSQDRRLCLPVASAFVSSDIGTYVGVKKV